MVCGMGPSSLANAWSQTCIQHPIAVLHKLSSDPVVLLEIAGGRVNVLSLTGIPFPSRLGLAPCAVKHQQRQSTSSKA